MKIIKKHLSLVILCFLALIPLTKANGATPDVLEILLDEMWHHYDILLRTQEDSMSQLNTFKLMDQAANKIMSIYQESENKEDLSVQTAQGLVLLALAAYEVSHPTLTYHAFQTAQRINPRTVAKMKTPSEITFKEELNLKQKIDRIQRDWLPQFKESRARVYGFDKNVIMDTLRVGIEKFYLERRLRDDRIYRAIDWAADYLNSELRNGKKEITLLLPPGMYYLKTDGLDIYPADFEVEKDSPPTVFDITPDRYFNLRVFYCKDTTIWTDSVVHTDMVEMEVLEPTHKISKYVSKKYPNHIAARVDTVCDTVWTKKVNIHRVALSPKDVDVWKGNRKLDRFDHLAFSEYDFAIDHSSAAPGESRFVRFLPEELNWDMPENERFKAEDIHVGSGDTYEYCIDVDLSKPELRVDEPYRREPTPEWCREFCKKCKCTTVWDVILSSTFMAAAFGLFLYTINK